LVLVAKRKPKTIPRLSPEKLQLAIQEVQASRLSAAAKQTVIAMLQAAANPDSQRIDVVLRTLQPDRRRTIERTASKVNEATNKTLARARAALLELSDDEWQRLVDDANN
jgi:hypothetical protein